MITQAVLRAYIDEVQHDEFIKGSMSDARQHTRVCSHDEHTNDSLDLHVNLS